jgi:hypothetical protein
MAPRISLQIGAVERKHRLQQALLRIGIVSFNVCYLAEHVRDRSREDYKYVLSPSNLLYSSITGLRKVEQALRLRYLISSSLCPLLEFRPY